MWKVNKFNLPFFFKTNSLCLGHYFVTDMETQCIVRLGGSLVLG